MKSLVLAEKPSVGKDLARVLGCNKVTKGFAEGRDYVVTWSLGHLVELAEPHDYSPQWKEWRMEHLPMLPDQMKLQVIRNVRHQFNTVQRLMQRKDIAEFIIATDAGREGELVARWIIRLGGWQGSIKRLWISSQTDTAIKDGFANLKPGKAYENLYSAAQCRAEADWLIGLNITRALTCQYDIQLTAGRVQTPTLAMIVNREQEIRNFIPQDYWTLRADFGDFFGVWRHHKGHSRLFDYDQAKAIADKIDGQTGRINDVQIRAKSTPPPLAYDLTELQRDANRYFNFSAKHTLAQVQKLYEFHKIVTYPRTDSRYITTDMVPTLPHRLKAISTGPYQKMVAPLLKQKLNPGARVVNNARVSDHHAIIPTEQPPNWSRLSNDERRVYELIVERFIAVLYPPFQYDQMTIMTEVKGEVFYAQGKVIKNPGWRAVTDPVVDEDADPGDDPDQILKQQQQGAFIPVKGIKLNAGQTKPPARYTEATLLSAMESPGKFIDDEELRESIKAGGLGTPATRAEIIEKIIGNHYVERKGKSLAPTGQGMQLIELVPDELRSPELTAEWELRLSNIAAGKEKWKGFMADIRNHAIKLVREVKNSTQEYKPENLVKEKCPLCGKPMMTVQDGRIKKTVCSDKRCGFQDEGDMYESFGKRKSFQSKKRDSALAKKYSDNAAGGMNLGEALKAALEKKG